MWRMWGRRLLLADPHRLGRWGQRQAEKYLCGKGFRLVARNYRIREGELDLVLSDDDGRIVFAEVKTRRGEDFAPAVSAVNYKKRIRMARAARSFVRRYKLSQRPLRFDVLTVIVPPAGSVRIRHYTNVFTP